MSTKDEKKITNEKPVSLFPLPFEKALAALLKVKPKPKAKKPKKRSQKKSSE